jgi:hypothetical protein
MIDVGGFEELREEKVLRRWEKRETLGKEKHGRLLFAKMKPNKT